MRWLSSGTRWAVRRPLRALAVIAAAGLVLAGTAVAVSSHAAVAPSNSSLPSISGKVAVGSTVTANTGTWHGSTPIGFQYQWRICDEHGNACHDIAGATGQSYAIPSADAGNTLRVHVIASNADGSSSATSQESARIAATASPPVNASLPSINGTVAVGSTVSADPGTWHGAAPISFHYQWQICGDHGNACHDIAGATGQSYAIPSADAGNTLRVHVVASNADGSSTATSGASLRIAVPAPAPQPAPTGCPKMAAGLEAVAVADVSAPARLVIDRFQLLSGPITSSMTGVQVRFHVTDTCGQAVSSALVYATAVPYNQVTIPAETATDGSGWVTLTFARAAAFPASHGQQQLTMFVRARRTGDSLLAGISSRRLIALPVDLGR